MSRRKGHIQRLSTIIPKSFGTVVSELNQLIHKRYNTDESTRRRPTTSSAVFSSDSSIPSSRPELPEQDSSNSNDISSALGAVSALH